MKVQKVLCTRSANNVYLVTDDISRRQTSVFFFKFGMIIPF